jgi:hypothetical protein
VFPGSYLLGRRVADWRWFYAGFLGTTVIFSAGFARMGQLGSAEQSRTRVVATAYQLADGLYDVTQWTCAASRDGDLYALTNSGSGRLFTACQELDAVNGIVRQQDGRFDIDMPPASTCNILQRARMEGPSLGVQVEQLQASAESLQQFSVRFSPEVHDRSMLVCAMYRNGIYQMTSNPAGASLANDRRDAAHFVNTMGALPWDRGAYRIDILGNEIDEALTSTQSFQRLLHQTVGTTLNLAPNATAGEFTLDRSIVRLMIYAPLPEAMQLAGDQFPDQRGFVLYVIDLPTPVANP